MLRHKDIIWVMMDSAHSINRVRKVDRAQICVEWNNKLPMLA